MSNHLLKEASDEVLYLRKLLQKHKIDMKNNKLPSDENLKSIDNFIRLTQIIYAKINFLSELK